MGGSNSSTEPFEYTPRYLLVPAAGMLFYCMLAKVGTDIVSTVASTFPSTAQQCGCGWLAMYSMTHFMSILSRKPVLNEIVVKFPGKLNTSTGVGVGGAGHQMLS